MLLASAAWAACLSGCVPAPSLAEDDPDAAVVDQSDCAPPPDTGRYEDLLPFVPSNFTECDLLEAVNDPVLLTASATYQLDTDTAMLSGPEGDIMLASVVVAQQRAPDILVIATSSFELGPGASLDVDGRNALALVSTGDLTINGLIDVGAVRADSGPGGDDAEACLVPARGGNGAPQGGGGSGGGGGGFSHEGGTGAPVAGVPGGTTPGGEASGNGSLVPLRGGCAGGDGGLAAEGSGTGGGGGGALQLVAGGNLIVASGGTLTARGGGGRGVDADGVDGTGGGGGGSGGGLLLEAMMITLNGAATANGGAGGEGRRDDPATTRDGEDGHDRDPDAALGGNGRIGGDGGTGGAASSLAGGNGHISSSDTENAGGGGGGGSAGRIHLRALGPLDTTRALFSPAPTGL